MLEQLTRAEVQPRLLRSVIIITERNGHDTVQKRPQFAGRVVAGEHIGADTQRKAVDIGKRTLELPLFIVQDSRSRGTGKFS